MSELQPHQQRVVDEKIALDQKYTSLTAFSITETFANLDEAERDRLKRQHAAMSEYSGILGERIAAF